MQQQRNRFKWLPQPSDWERLIAFLSSSPGPVAWDTEYLLEEGAAPAHASRLHVWSVAAPMPGAKISARGTIPAVAAVLPAESLKDPVVRAWLASDQEKWAHNAGVDRHAVENLGQTTVGGCRDSLSLSRWVYPDRVAPGPGFSLDSLGRSFLGYGKTTDFKSLVTRPHMVEKAYKTCPCPEGRACKKRTKGHAALHGPRYDMVEMVRRGDERFPLSDIAPGHPRFEDLVEYSAFDALVGCECVQLILRDAAKERKLPW